MLLFYIYISDFNRSEISIGCEEIQRLVELLIREREKKKNIFHDTHETSFRSVSNRKNLLLLSKHSNTFNLIFFKC